MAFLLGESDVPLPLTADDVEEDKPVRLLRDWAIFDARPRKATGIGGRGALALELIPLNTLDDVVRAMRPCIVRMRKMQDRRTMAIMMTVTVLATRKKV
jgi:hypothetical protein